MASVSLNKADFSRALAIAGAMAGRSKSVPILDCVKCVVKDDAIAITSCDGNTAITKKINIGESMPSISFCINAKDISTCIKTIMSENIEIQIESESATSCTIKHNNGEFELPLFMVVDFPVLDCDKEMKSFQMDSATLSEWVKDASRFVASDDLRPAMSGMYIYAKGMEAGFCATDSRKLVTAKSAIDFCDADMNAIIPSSIFRQILDVCGERDNVVIKIGASQIILQAGNTALLSRKIEGRYPNYEAIIPKNVDGFLTIDRNAITSSLIRMSSVSDSKTDHVKLQIAQDVMVLTSEDLLCGKKATDKCACTSNKELTIGLRNKNFMDGIYCFDTERVSMGFSAYNKPVVLESEPANDKKVIIMPIVVAQ